MTHHFGMGVIGLASPDDLGVAVCVPEGCELEFLEPMCWACGALVYKGDIISPAFAMTPPSASHIIETSWFWSMGASCT